MLPSAENAGAPASVAPRGLAPEDLPPAAAAVAPPDPPDEAAAWAEVVRGWEDEARHRVYLARFRDLDGLALAGRRYREALAARPGDPLAARFRDEVVRRALACGLASLPRSAPAEARGRTVVRLAALAVLAALATAALLVGRELLDLAGARP